jgi:hypothetical protein
MAFTFRDLRKMGSTHVQKTISATTYFLNGKTDVRPSGQEAALKQRPVLAQSGRSCANSSRDQANNLS